MTGSGNTAVGTNTVFRTGALQNATAIGAGAEVDQSNALVLGCVQSDRCPSAVLVGIGTTTPDAVLSVAGNADKVGGGSWDTYSDGRLKNVNGSFASGLDQVMQLRPIRYRYKPGEWDGHSRQGRAHRRRRARRSSASFPKQSPKTAEATSWSTTIPSSGPWSTPSRSSSAR